MKSSFRAPASPPGTSRATPPVKGERSEGEAFTLDQGLHWESTAGSRFLVVPARSAYQRWHMPKRYWAMMTEFREDWDTELPELKAGGER